MKTYKSPKAEIKSFISEDVITTSSAQVNNPLKTASAKAFLNSDANVSWKDKIN